MIGKTNAGAGGGHLNDTDALLRVSAPTGSTITMAKGGVTVAVLAATKGHTNASDATLADWYYGISSGNYGSWTVTAAKDGESASKTVTVDNAKQYDVSLSYALYLISNGQLQSGYNLYGGSNTISQESDHVLAKGGSGTVYFCSVGPVSGITYPYLILKVSDEKINNSTAKFGIASTSAYSQDAWLAQ